MICFIFNGFLFFVNDFVGIILVSKSMRMVELESYSLEFPHGCIVDNVMYNITGSCAIANTYFMLQANDPIRSKKKDRKSVV